MKLIIEKDGDGGGRESRGGNPEQEAPRKQDIELSGVCSGVQSSASSASGLIFLERKKSPAWLCGFSLAELGCMVESTRKAEMEGASDSWESVAGGEGKCDNLWGLAWLRGCRRQAWQPVRR